MSDEQNNESKWTTEKDEEGNTYYYNNETGESQWDVPAELADKKDDSQTEGKNGSSTDANGDGGDKNGDNAKPQWSEEKDEDGNIYYYDSVSGQTQWEKPDGMDDAAEEPKDDKPTEDEPTSNGKAKWVAVKNEEGETYYYNEETEETQWEEPAEGFVKADDAPDNEEEKAKSGDDDKPDVEEKRDAASDKDQGKEKGGTKWVAHKDDEGKTYYYNEETEETQWDEPEEGFVEAEKEHEQGTGEKSSEEKPVEDEKQDEASGQNKNRGQSKWVAHKDEEGRTYYFNEETEETQWDEPAEGFVEAEQAEKDEKEQSNETGVDEDKPKEASESKKSGETKWVAHKDEEGRTYYYNEETEETQWDEPAEGFVNAEDAEKGQEQSSDAKPEEDKQPAKKAGKTTKWVAHTDEEGRTYYYNQETEETQWDEPAEGFMTAEDAEKEQEQSKEAGEEDDNQPAKKAVETKWVAHTDEEGRTYYYNQETQETQWDEPAEGFVKAEDVVTEGAEAAEGEQAGTWMALTDDEGREYYYNKKTNETSWEVPENAKIVRESDQMEVEKSQESTKDKAETPSQEPADMEVEPPEPEVVEEEVDPAVKRLRDAEAALAGPDSILEPDCFSNVTEVVANEGGNPTKALNLLVENYHSQTGVCGLLARWLSNMKSSSASSATRSKEESSELTNNEIRKTAQDVICRVAKERFSKETGDGILDLSKSQAAFLNDMMDSSQWRELLIDLSARHKDSAVLMYCLRTISKRGHHREIARRINQSDHFAVFRQMLQSELTVIGNLSISAGHDVTTSIGMEEVIDDLRRACTSTSYTYLYSMEVLRALEQKAREAPDASEEMRRAFRRWEFLREDLENTMADQSAGSSVILRKRRLDIALTISELHQRKRRRFTPPDDREEPSDGQGKLETALLKLLRRHAMKTKIDDSSLDPLLPSGMEVGGGASIGDLLVKHPLAIRALLGCLYKPGSARVTSDVLKNKCARLVALAVLAAEKDAVSSDDSKKSDEVAVIRMILDGRTLCEEIETRVSFLVSDGGKATSEPSAGLKLCNLATSSAAVAQGTIMWAKELTNSSEFPLSASFSTLSVSILSLVRRIAIAQPFTRRDALSIALVFTQHANPDVNYQTMSAIKEQSIRLMLVLISKGEASAVLSGMTARLQKQPVLDASLVRYFVSGLLEITKIPVSPAFARVLAQFLRVPKCVDAVRSSYFGEPHQSRLNNLLRSFAKLPVDEKQELSRKAEKSWVEAVLTTYRLD